jgi:hypothetical protein
MQFSASVFIFYAAASYGESCRYRTSFVREYQPLPSPPGSFTCRRKHYLRHFLIHSLQAAGNPCFLSTQSAYVIREPSSKHPLTQSIHAESPRGLRDQTQRSQPSYAPRDDRGAVACRCSRSLPFLGLPLRRCSFSQLHRSTYHVFH